MVKAAIFDMGGTLEDITHTPEMNRNCGELLLACLKRNGIELPETADELMEILEKRNCDYREWSLDNNRELTPYEIWSQWYLEDRAIDYDRLRVIADVLANIWERNFYKRTLRPDAAEMLNSLNNMSIRMGVISNTACLTQVIEILHEYGIHEYFGPIYLSCVSGFRKPHTGMFLAAAADLEITPDEAVYVGDTVSRDVRGSRAAGYRASIRIDSKITQRSDQNRAKDGEEADFVIASLSEIPGIIEKLNATD
ncbi:MAG: HAD family hydrolase [Lachnospiraceae bacterium]|jgi:putative hydrolase of the HAD superfamily|nr:HAD family hydrolase [Lachnospiraceae bacterium]